jgi:hypothetical protein
MWRHHPHLHRLLIILPLALALFASACTVTTSSEGTGGGSTPGASATPAASTTASGSGGSFADCAHATGFSGAGAADAGSSFSDVSFPDNSVSVLNSSFTDTYQFKIIKVCSNSSSASAVRSFFASNLTSSGWTNVSHYPYHGDPTSSCGDPNCWRKAGSPMRYVSLESMSTAGSVALYSLRLAISPSAPTAQMITHYTTVSGSSGTLTATAKCAAGEQMVSGGYYIDNTNMINTVFSNYPSASNTWTASQTLYVTVSTKLLVYVVCMKANFLLHTQIVHNTATVAGGSTVPVTVGCPSGTKVTGGGFKATPNGYTFIVGSTPGALGWGMATRLGAGTSISETVYALCAHNVSSPTILSNSFTVGSRSQNAVDVTCGAGMLRTGGGFSNSDPSGDANNFAFSSAPAKVDSMWVVDMYNRDGVSAHGAIAWAVCDTPNPTY